MTRVLKEAREAYARREWARARELYIQARSAAPLGADDIYALSDAAWWLGLNDEVLEACERAFHLYQEEGRPSRAAIPALDIAVVHFLRGEDTVGAGWLSRTQRLLESQPESAEHGYTLYLTEVEGALGGVIASDEEPLDKLLLAAQRVQEIGRRHNDPNLVALGVLGEGRALVKAGRVPEGLALLDETMVSVLSDELHPVWAGNTYCHLMAAAHELSDIKRARQWTEATTRWLETLPAAVVFNGICRVHRSQVHQISGDWQQAEEEAARVCEDLAGIHTATAAEAHYQVGEMRRLRGDLSGADHAYRRAHNLGRDPQPGLALAHLAQGKLDAAAASIRAALVAETSRLSRARLLAAHVEIALAAGDLKEAPRASDELEGIARVYGSSGLEVMSRHARGAIVLAEGRPDEALPILRDACRRWTEVDAPYDCARIRVLLARAYRALGDEDAATRELDAAEPVFERLEAALDLRGLAELREGPRLPRGLTEREAEVLALVAAGQTNREVASELIVSEKTVARHLSNIFAKIGVTSRTAAAAFAFEHGLAQR